MQNIDFSELYFIAAMMILITVICAVSVYVFFRTYKKEMKDKQKRIEEKRKEQIKKEQIKVENAQK